MLNTTQLTEKQRKVIQLFQKNAEILDLREFCKKNNIEFNFVKGFIGTTLLDNYLKIEDISKDIFVLSSKGRKIDGCIQGFLLASQLNDKNSLDVMQLQKELGQSNYSIHFGSLKKEKAVEVRTEGDDNSQKLYILDRNIIKQFIRRQEVFAEILIGEEVLATEELEWLIHQKLVEKKSVDNYSISVNSEIQKVIVQRLITTVTSDLLISGQWNEVKFKPYNIHDDVPDIKYGLSCILTQCLQLVREIFLDMGFDEMSGQIVDSSFWNFDALFTAQDHPAREIQDTFYLSKPQFLALPDNLDLVRDVKAAHEIGHGSIWTEEEASRAILRTHTTASTARNLYRLGGQDIKYFSIDKVFRNESVDKTHLAEFYQIEGVIVAPDLSVRDLIGYLTDFYNRLGFTKFKFKPTYNPYTEPSLEVYAYHPPSDSYMEVANSGVFRPEMLKPLGYEGRSTIAWGLGLERIAMLLYGIDKLSELVGPGIDLNPPQKY
jgi:phenylalanyl-tRNA synthetase alpha chain